jgi:hypothetical protein
MDSVRDIKQRGLESGKYKQDEGLVFLKHTRTKKIKLPGRSECNVQVSVKATSPLIVTVVKEGKKYGIR